MVQTRRSTQKPGTKTANKTITKDNAVGKKKTQNANNDRCKLWVQQQKKEKLKFQPDNLDSNSESDEETRELNVANISVRFNEEFQICPAEKWRLEFFLGAKI